MRGRDITRTLVDAPVVLDELPRDVGLVNVLTLEALSHA
jgi:hypothetical protein